MDNAIKEIYQHEYTTTNISLADLATKYNEPLPMLLDIGKDWVKYQPVVVDEAEVVIANEEPDAYVLRKALIAKKKVIDQALVFLSDKSAQYLTVKELKDLNAIATDMVNSSQGNDTGTTININVQNLISQFTDDC